MLDFLFTKTPLMYFVQDFWRDEAFTVMLAKQNFSDIVAFTTRDFNPPLYYFIVHIWMRLFGSSEIAVRSLSLLFYLGTVLVVFLFMERVFRFSPKKSYFYTFAFLFNPLLLYNAFEARMYAMLAFFATLSWYFLKRGKPRLYIVATVLGLYTHYFMILVLLSQIFYIASSHLLKKKAKLRDYREIGVSFLYFVPWLIFLFLSHRLGQEQFWILQPQFDTYTHMPSLLYTGYEFDFEFFQRFLLPFTIFLNIIPLYGLFQLRHQREKYRDIFLFLTSWTFIPVFITFGLSLTKPLFLPRYLIASSVGFSILLIYILDEFPHLVRLVLTFFLVLYSSIYIGFHIRTRPKAPVRQTIREIKMLAKNNEPLYVVNELDFFTAQYYFDPNRVFIYAKDYEEIPSYTGKVLISKEKLVHKLPYYPKKAFVLKEDLSYSIEALL